MSQRQTLNNQPPLAHTTTHNTQQKTENTVTMVPPSHQLPAAPILQKSTIAICCAIDHNHCNTAMYFFWRHLLFLYLFYYYSMCSGSACSLTKGEFLKIYLVLFCAAASKRCELTPAIWCYLIWQCCPSTHLVLAWFWTGGGAPLSQCFQEGRGMFGCC